jgi:hypothetical protein
MAFCSQENRDLSHSGLGFGMKAPFILIGANTRHLFLPPFDPLPFAHDIFLNSYFQPQECHSKVINRIDA